MTEKLWVEFRTFEISTFSQQKRANSETQGDLREIQNKGWWTKSCEQNRQKRIKMKCRMKDLKGAWNFLYLAKFSLNNSNTWVIRRNRQNIKIEETVNIRNLQWYLKAELGILGPGPPKCNFECGILTFSRLNPYFYQRVFNISFN